MAFADDPLSALDAARARVQAQVAQARERSAEAHRLSDGVRDAVGTATSFGREVSATARAGGVVERIEISDRALDLDAATLSRLVTSTVQTAQRTAADAALREMATTLGPTSAVVTETRAQIARRFGAVEKGRR